MTAGRSRTCLTMFRLFSVAWLSATFANVVLASPNETKVHELAPGVYFRKTQTEPEILGCNQGWIVLKHSVLVIDANFPNQAKETIKSIRGYTDKPIRYVFDTHYHGDHADGNVRYVEQGAIVVASERSQALFATKGILGFEGAQQQAGRKAEYGGLAYEQPTLLFPHRLVIDDGVQRVELLHFGHAHTAGDAVAWLPKQGILFTGDACVNGPFNYTGDANTESWIAVLGSMQELPVKVVCPGHGELADNKLLETQKRYFVELRREIKSGIEAGRKLDEIKSSLNIPFYKEWTGVDVTKQTENIEHVYKELGGK